MVADRGLGDQGGPSYQSCVNLRDRLAAIERQVREVVDDFIPESDSDAPLALQEMRDALRAIIDAPDADSGEEPNDR